jgi:Ca2+-binding RTX toxin-like protein
MNLQYSYWSTINLTDFDGIFSETLDGPGFLDNIDFENATIKTANNKTIAGSFDGYQFTIKGSNFLNAINGTTSSYTITSVQIKSSSYAFSMLGNMSVDYSTEQYSGYYTSFSYSHKDSTTGSTESYSFKGQFNIDSDTGDASGGLVTSFNASFQGYTFNVQGNFTVNADFEATSGTINSLLIQDASKNTYSFSGATLDAAQIFTYIDSDTYTDLTALYNYVSANLSGNLNITAGAENDTLVGGSGKDTLNAGAGDDALDGASGVDKLTGGSGNDTYTVDLVRSGSSASNYKVSLQDTVTESANGGTDTIELRGSYSLSKMSKLTLSKNVENLDASATGTTLLKLVGNKLNNALTGNDAQNGLEGGDGNDVLSGGLDADTLTGGKGSDTFSYALLSDSTSSASDIITDFKTGQDDIDLSALDAGGQTLAYSGTTATAYSVWYAQSSGNTIVYVDTTGDAVSDMQIQLTGTISLQSSDFVLS